MIKESLLDCAPGIKDCLARYDSDEVKMASQYEDVLRSNILVTQNGYPVFDLILLGIGEDGHTASLFPGDAALDVNGRWVVPVIRPDYRRISMTLPVINAARHVMFFVMGSHKASIIHQIKAGEGKYPAGRVKPAGELIYILDSQAGSL